MYQKGNKELEIISLYTDYTKQFYLREISKLSGIPLKTTQNITSNLERKGILKSNTKGKNKYFKLNLDNIQTKLFILESEVHKTIQFLDKQPLFKTFLKEVKNNDTIILFGSLAKLTPGKNSDADLLIITGNEEKQPYHLLPYKTHEVRLTETTFTKALEKKETLIKEIEEHHVILNNHSFYTNQLWNYYGK